MNYSDIDMENELTYTRFDYMAEKYPQNSAVIYLGEHFSYTRLHDLSLRFAGSLQGL